MTGGEVWGTLMGRLKLIVKGDIMRSLRILVLVFVLLVGVVSFAFADTPYPYVQWIDFPVEEDVSLFILPDGSGPDLSEAQGFGGTVVDATIRVKLIMVDGVAIGGFPGEDVWLQDESGSVFSCPGGFFADNSSDASGIITFSSSMAGGGHTEGPIYVYVVGNRAYDPQDYPFPMTHPPVEGLHFNSADINGDGLINLSDIGLFSEDFFGMYNYRSDFYWDGYLNLSDVSKLALALGRTCQ